MMSNKFHEQPGLEVAPEPELPQVVEGPTIIEKPYDGTTQYAYQQQPQAYQNGFYQNHAYPNDAYPPSGYPQATQPIVPAQAQSYWGSSQNGAQTTEKLVPDSAPPSSGMILGLKKKTFWLTLGPLVALLVVSLAVGLGVGMGTQHKPSSTAANATATPIVCPQSNGTVYQGAGDDPFLVLCNIDYNGNGANSGTTDIGNEPTSSIDDCITACSNNSTCVGAGWGSYQGSNICWMKGSLGSSQESDNWFFVIKQDGSN
ncbi:hypothetical protein F4804DRAFT_308767 [Jackrogersella minutella]|nr:hypothetical protein F4804DRAFT_308767 [Jackrogersella minutella]